MIQCVTSRFSPEDHSSLPVFIIIVSVFFAVFNTRSAAHGRKDKMVSAITSIIATIQDLDKNLAWLCARRGQGKGKGGARWRFGWAAKLDGKTGVTDVIEIQTPFSTYQVWHLSTKVAHSEKAKVSVKKMYNWSTQKFIAQTRDAIAGLVWESKDPCWEFQRSWFDIRVSVVTS